MTENPICILDPSRFTPSYDHCFCNALADEGLDPWLITSPFLYDKDIPGRRYRQVEFFYRATHAIFGLRKNRLRQLAKACEHVTDWLRLLVFLKKNRCRLVHVQWVVIPKLDLFFLKVLCRLGIPVVYTAHNAVPHDTGDAYVSMYTKLYGQVDRVIAHTEKTRETLVEKMAVPPEKIHIVPVGNFVYLRNYPAVSTPDLTFLRDRKVVLFFGAVRPYKGLDILIAAFREVRKTVADAHLLIVGRLNENPGRYLRLFDQFGIADAVTVKDGFLPDEAIPAIADLADIAVFPYLDIDQSAAIITMASLGLPMVASDIGGLREVVIEGYNGFRVPPNDVEALAGRIQEILGDDNRLARMAENSEKLMRENFDWSDIAQSTKQIYSDLLGQSRGRA